MHILRLAFRTAAVRFATLAAALDEGSGEHLTKGAQTADEFAAGGEFCVVGHIWH
jgi:hypothetical protein